ncbi:Eco57I restriction-modification methylase domain-containing protein [Micromonospora ureilytica]|uniref:site-specific DNA-methyltransferase (adenine-specific) n=1 Tax=Micromonospora ureilytica TaxID=709868 RepID=A0ABS0JQ86_9ACTN|nr:Eco57I restriction-modification methylase domain-containing protein [Micromonospora ureilytica]MBG6069181.1 adenine-specific DNA-methyltransferase [Micromonospora ureilytica]
MLLNELTDRAETQRTRALASLDPARQASLGQYFTPARAASLIAAMPQLPVGGRLRVLDPGAGSGSLTAALVRQVLTQSPGLQLEVVAVEIDPSLAPSLEATLDDAARTAEAAGGSLVAKVVLGDFIDMATSGSEPALRTPFDLVVMNPPYGKLGSGSKGRVALSALGVDCPNLYAAFLALGVQALRPGGQLAAITPRSFANGPYFASFRDFLLDRITIKKIHLFDSRSSVFSDTGVLQENVVISGIRGGQPSEITISSSRGDADDAVRRVVSYEDVVRPGDPERFIRIATGEDDALSTQMISSLPSTLKDLGLKVSTGKVVDFRSRPYLREQPEATDLPLIYPGNLRNGLIEWPRKIRKAQGFAALDVAAQKLLLPSGCYVAIKRFSAKEERRRIVAAVWDPAVNGPTSIAFENHLNIIHANGQGIDRQLAVGLSLWLNSSVVDRAFRTFSGHTQVNATDLRSMRFPTIAELNDLGHGQPLALPDQEKIDALVHPLVSTHAVEGLN